MSIEKYNNGSEWRKWDLHVHTPSSIENNYKKNGSNDVWESFITDLENLPDEIKVIGINDYIFIDGYKKVLEYKKKGRLQNIELILPVIELRLARFCGHQKFKRINYHIIFSNEISPEVIEHQFLNTLSAQYKLDPNSDVKSWDGFISESSLKSLGQQIINSVPESKRQHFRTPIVEGFNNLNLEISDINNSLQKASTYFSGKYLTAVGKTEWDELKWDDTSIAEKKTIINSVDFIFTAAESIDKFYCGKRTLVEQHVNNLLLDCSDSHSNLNSENKDRLGNCFTWIKADPTFEGLKQILNEPNERVFIGEEPLILQQVKTNRTKYIKSLNIEPVPEYDNIFGKWFNNNISLNKGLVAIIGNKGNGKSAIADIIAHCSNCSNQDFFSFLNKNKFRNGKLAQNFQATLTFEDNKSFTKNLNGYEGVDENKTPMVKYLPQGYFESICNDLQKEEDLRREIENVVFQYIDETDRLGTSSFKELIDKKTDVSNEIIESLKADLSKINRDIITLEKKENITYISEIKAKIEEKENEINALIEPLEVKEPNRQDYKNISIIHEINSLNTRKEETQCSINEKTIEIKKITIDIEKLKDLISRINNTAIKVKQFVDSNKELATSLGVDIDNIIHLNIDMSSIESLLETKNNNINTLKNELYNKTPGSLSYELNNIENEIAKKQVLLDGPQKEYQIYLKNKENYNNAKKGIEGSGDMPNTLLWYKKEQSYIEHTLKNDINKLHDNRIDVVRKIYEEKLTILNVYKIIKQRIDEIIKDNEDLLNAYEIKIDATLSINSNFNNDILYYIKQNVKGSFKGTQEGCSLLTQIIKENNIQDIDGIISICNDIIERLKYDRSKEEERFIDDQVDNMQAFYDYLFSLDYLNYNYQLKQDNKELSLLSPGEKGALLLVFYLLLDVDNKPLILDQPEDNLDNDSVANILVNFIKKAKIKRQIIIVTHNPNLAIVADAEQIIYVSIDKRNECKVYTESGSIENPNINKHIVDVLEGAMPAFRKRDDKYIANL